MSISVRLSVCLNHFSSPSNQAISNLSTDLDSLGQGSTTYLALPHFMSVCVFDQPFDPLSIKLLQI